MAGNSIETGDRTWHSLEISALVKVWRRAARGLGKGRNLSKKITPIVRDEQKPGFLKNEMQGSAKGFTLNVYRASKGKSDCFGIKMCGFV